MIRPEEINAIAKTISAKFNDTEREIITATAEVLKQCSQLDFDTLNVAYLTSRSAKSILRKALAEKKHDVISAIREAVYLSQRRDSDIYARIGKRPKKRLSDDILYLILMDELDEIRARMDDILSEKPVNGRLMFGPSFERQMFDLLMRERRQIRNGREPRKAVADAVAKLSDGVMASMSERGRMETLHTYIERTVSTGIAHASGRVAMEQAKLEDHDLMQMSAHIGARIGDGGPDLTNHSWWQGHVVSLSGKEGYLTLDDIGYGDILGFLGINCRHSWYPWTPELGSIYTDEYLDRINNATVVFEGKEIPVRIAEQKRNYWHRRSLVLVNRSKAYDSIGYEREAIIARIMAANAEAKYRELDRKIGDINYG